MPGRNLVHGSDSAESAERELGLWFNSSDDVINWNPVVPQVIRKSGSPTLELAVLVNITSPSAAMVPCEIVQS